MEKNILLYIPIKNNQFSKLGFEILSEALRLKPNEDWHITAVCFTDNVEELLAQKLQLPIHSLYCIETKEAHDINLKAKYIKELCEEIQPTVFLISASLEGRALAPMVAASLKTGLTADCTELSLSEDGKLMQTRPAFEETLLATIQTSTLPQMATVRPGSVLPLADFTPLQTTIVTRQAEVSNAVTLCKVEAIQSNSIADEKILVAAGAGVKKDDLQILENFAHSLNGKLASSRKLVECGFMPQEKQIGLSGTAVSADLLITVGISGSTQFMAGINNVKKIIAINNDEHAPIFSRATQSILMDADEFIQFLRNEVE